MILIIFYIVGKVETQMSNNSSLKAENNSYFEFIQGFLEEGLFELGLIRWAELSMWRCQDHQIWGLFSALDDLAEPSIWVRSQFFALCSSHWELNSIPWTCREGHFTPLCLANSNLPFFLPGAPTHPFYLRPCPTSFVALAGIQYLMK